jgi:hypothetical protein
MPWKAANCKAFLHFPANQVLLEMVKNQTPRLTGAAFFWATVLGWCFLGAALPRFA